MRTVGEKKVPWRTYTAGLEDTSHTIDHLDSRTETERAKRGSIATPNKKPSCNECNTISLMTRKAVACRVLLTHNPSYAIPECTAGYYWHCRKQLQQAMMKV